MARVKRRAGIVLGEWPADIEASLIADEEEREKRDKKRVKFCPCCGRKPEEPPDKAGRHIYTVFCEKCQARMVIHVNG